MAHAYARTVDLERPNSSRGNRRVNYDSYPKGRGFSPIIFVTSDDMTNSN